MQDAFKLDKPLPYQLVYSNRSIWHVFAMGEKAKKPILANPVDVEFRWGKPMTAKPFHRVYQIDWTEDGRMQYWTPGYDKPAVTNLTRESIDAYYDVVANKIDEQANLGPRPTTKHLDGSTTYSPCNYCDYSEICNSKENISPTEFLDRAQEMCQEKWAERERHLK
jgi:hypothetical protein